MSRIRKWAADEFSEQSEMYSLDISCNFNSFIDTLSVQGVYILLYIEGVFEIFQ